MTEEELEKMAIKYAETINLNNVNISGVVRNHIKYAVIVGYNAYKQQFKAENTALKTRVKELEEEKCELLGLIQAKDKMIEKMKCCNNCKLYQCEKWKNNEINYHFSKCENWELVE